MSWTEYLNGKWTPRQVSADIYKTGFVAPTGLSAIDSFVFLALKGDNGRGGETVAIALAAPSPAESCPAFFFYDNRISVKAPVSTLSLQHVDVPVAVTSKTFGTCISSGTTRYAAIQGSYGSDNTVTWQPESSKLMLEQDGFDARVTTMMKVTKEGKEEEVKLTLGSLAHADSDSLMAEAASVNGMKDLIDLMATRTEEDYYGGSGGIYNELKKPHAIYHWELGLHIPMLLVDHFLQGQQFEEALAVCRHVFDPIAPIDKAITMGPADSEAQQRMKRNGRLWKFRPFKEIETTTLERLLLQTIGSKPGENIPAVTNWREKPFLPHLVARERPIAYMRWVVTKYIEVLIAYGDFYFRQNTIDSLPNAIQLYMLASHLCGPRGEKIPRQNPSPLTYANLVGKLDAFSNAIVRMEEVWPISNQITAAAGTSPVATNIAQDALPTMFGFSTAFYFSIPDNPKMREQRDLVDDRLFKIRHSQDINGILRKLPLFDPPLDPGLLIKAKAQGLQLSSVLSAINGPMPNYRFQYLLGRAMELANEVQSLGAALLASKEKYDAEMINSLRATHETNTFAIGMDIKKLSLKEALMAQVAAEESRKGPAFRLDFYKRTLGIKTAAPGIEDDFGEEKVAIADPVTDGASRLLQDEKLEMDKYEEAQDKQQDVVRLDFLAGVFHALPVIATHATPLGCGVAFQFGPPNIAYGMQAASSALRLGADALVYQASSAGRKANSLRGTHERYLQLNTAGHDLKVADKQILAARIRVDLAKQEIASQEKQQRQAVEYEEYLRSKFTNAELYSWMNSAVKTLYFDMYNQAYEVASKAVKTFKYERPRDTTDYLKPSYWDTSREGFMSGERLYHSLKQLETAYQEERGYDFEITKHFSLRQVNPIALMTLREAKVCNFNLSEALFDLDFPGHYLRRIKSVSLSVPCVAGPYTSISTVLRLTSHKYRINSTVGGGYSENITGEDARFSTARVPISTIATSSSIEDSGQFELNFQDERYLPFEGAGAISSWTLELPAVEPQFDYRTISDVILHVRYTAVDGGAGLRKVASEQLGRTIATAASSGHVLLDLRNEFASSWATVVGAAASAPNAQHVMMLPRMESALPFYLRSRVSSITATKVSILSDAELPPVTLSGDPAGKTNPQADQPDAHISLTKLAAGIVPRLSTLSGTSDEGISFKGGWSLKFDKAETINASRVWMLIEYTLAQAAPPK